MAEAPFGTGIGSATDLSSFPYFPRSKCSPQTKVIGCRAAQAAMKWSDSVAWFASMRNGSSSSGT